MKFSVEITKGSWTTYMILKANNLQEAIERCQADLKNGWVVEIFSTEEDCKKLYSSIPE